MVFNNVRSLALTNLPIQIILKENNKVAAWLQHASSSNRIAAYSGRYVSKIQPNEKLPISTVRLK